MSDSDLQTLTDFRSEIPEPDEETARRIYALSTAPVAGGVCDMSVRAGAWASPPPASPSLPPPPLSPS